MWEANDIGHGRQMTELGAELQLLGRQFVFAKKRDQTRFVANTVRKYRLFYVFVRYLYDGPSWTKLCFK